MSMKRWHANRELPRCFCWTKFGVEAGEGVSEIILRKERERRANDGIFLWGIGNSLGPSLACLLRKESEPEVIFSPILSEPRLIDVAPRNIFVWTEAKTIFGDSYLIPLASVVTSGSVRKNAHYALICYAEKDLKLELDGPSFGATDLRNVRTGRPVGSSQVTSIVERVIHTAHVAGRRYRVAMRAKLIPPYFVKLLNPIEVTDDGRLQPLLKRGIRFAIGQRRVGKGA